MDVPELKWMHKRPNYPACTASNGSDAKRRIKADGVAKLSLAYPGALLGISQDGCLDMIFSRTGDRSGPCNPSYWEVGV